MSFINNINEKYAMFKYVVILIIIIVIFLIGKSIYSGVVNKFTDSDAVKLTKEKNLRKDYEKNNKDLKKELEQATKKHIVDLDTVYTLTVKEENVTKQHNKIKHNLKKELVDIEEQKIPPAKEYNNNLLKVNRLKYIRTGKAQINAIYDAFDLVKDK